MHKSGKAWILAMKTEEPNEWQAVVGRRIK